MFEPTQLRSFLAVAQTRSFTQAAERLGLQQSTVSQHVRKLEDETGRRLFRRDTHSVATTPDGDAMVEFAQSILDANERAQSYFAGSQLRGRLRFGTSEDFVLSQLPEVLHAFVRAHPLVDLELTVALSGRLNQLLERGELDLICGKRRRGDERGQIVWRDRLIWAAGKEYRLDVSAPVPLILYPPPSITRETALAVLERAARPWRMVCVSGSLSGLRAAALAGLGVTPITRGLMPSGLVDLEKPHDLPDLGAIEFVLKGSTRRGPAAKLAEAILASGNRLQSSWQG
ncbi:DNA-binding transcriptional regulator, LysR family [Enhydrobacter aerosaccus]|uniref:DNA-binding transcriptional regulator, LysR family n=1 Tax=Enhydrobacter aerosaccus TaxID=225324 RepID=A0A1T4NSC3_9HYPH|nr:LysR family transcriptional regulator [Enhydrobacter aerosaccus]SJZ82189.1 DNA-binding transcriptional regulator, LysR family [Enhydrobacter aerosaccus]